MIRLITGGIGSGKCGLCLDEIEKLHSEQPEAQCLMLVNEHYSHETEKLFNERFGGTGLNNIEVTTFRKLSRELLSERERRTMTGAGQQMLLQKTVTQYLQTNPEINGKLRRAVRRSGFLDVLGTMIKEMKSYAVSAEELRVNAENVMDNKALQEKLFAIADMYEIYSENFDGLEYNDVRDLTEMLAAAVENSGKFENTYMWIDKFDELLPQQMKVVSALHRKVKQLTVSVCYPSDAMEAPLYSEVERTLNKVMALDRDVEHIDCGRHLKNIKSPEIKFLLENWDGAAEYDSKTNDIKIFEGRDAYNETEYAAAKISDLVREDNYRFRDIAVICGNEDEYGYLIDTVFDEYGIPAFPDSKIILSDHPIAVQIISLFDVFEEDFDYKSVFTYLKSGYIYEKTKNGVKNISRDNIDILENFVLKYGIRGKKKWLSDEDWKCAAKISDIAGDNEDSEKYIARLEQEERLINSIRKKIIKPIKKYDKHSGGKHTVKKHAELLFEFLNDINLYEGLRFEIMRFIKNDDINEADRFERIWGLIMDVLDQAVIALGNVKMDREEFGKYIKTGISKCEIRIIPSGIDRVYVGTAERNAPSDVKAMFILGAVGGTFPNEIKNEGFLSNADRYEINEMHTITLAPDTSGRMNKRRFGIFKTLSAATEKLFISYAAQDINGRRQSCSRLVTDIMRKFTDLKIDDDMSLNSNTTGIYVASPNVTIHRLLRNKNDNTDNPVWDAVYSYYEEHNMYPDLMRLLDGKKRAMSRQFEMIDESEALGLYGNERAVYSASRLNVYAQCPYRYFMQYGLNIKEREIWEIAANDIGTYAHMIIEGFCRSVEGNETDLTKKAQIWSELTEERKSEILDGLFKEAEEKVALSEINSRSKVLHIMKRMEKVISTAVETVHSSLKYGSYSIAGEECEVSMDINERVSLRGIIDRLDICDAGSYKGIRIIDYKTGRTAFNITNVLNGIDMQMVLYAAAAKEYYSRKDSEGVYRITGIYYSHVRGDKKNQKINDTKKNIQNEIMNARKLDGITFSTENGGTDVLYDMDSRLKNGEESDFLDIRLNKDGTFNANSKKKILSFSDGEKLVSKVKKIAEDYDNEIRSGVIKQNPYKEAKEVTACRYCDYAQICGIFDKIEGREPDKTKTIDGEKGADK